MQFPSGKLVTGKATNFNLADTNVTTIAFTDADGNAITFATGDRLIIYAVHANSRATAKTLTVFQDLNGNGTLDAGDEILVFSYAAAGDNEWRTERGLATIRINAAATNLFKAQASATGGCDVTILGEIVRS